MENKLGGYSFVLKRVLMSAGLMLICLFFSFCNNKTTCSDKIRNQGEEKIDCGGPCSPCPTCSDGIKNQDETGIDCGGRCSVCESCSDGIQNQLESGVDCGGPCKACDMIFPQNGVFGINILRQQAVDTGLVIGSSNGLSLAANVPLGQELRIKMTDIKYPLYTSWTLNSAGPWTVVRFGNYNYMTYAVKGPVTADAPVLTLNQGDRVKARIDFYKNSDTLPFFSKTIGWVYP